MFTGGTIWLLILTHGQLFLLRGVAGGAAAQVPGVAGGGQECDSESNRVNRSP